MIWTTLGVHSRSPEKSTRNPLFKFTCLAINVNRQKTHNIQYIPHTARRSPIKGEFQPASADRSRRNLACRLHIVNGQVRSDKERTFKNPEFKTLSKIDLLCCHVTVAGQSELAPARSVAGGRSTKVFYLPRISAGTSRNLVWIIKRK